MKKKNKSVHIICEKDVGLFSLVQQVIGHIPMALTEGRVPVAFFGTKCCYWTEKGYKGKINVWEYYFEPIIEDYPSSKLEKDTLSHIRSKHPHFEYPGYFLNKNTFVTNNFGDHKSFEGKALKIPYKWQDPNQELRDVTSKIIKAYIRPRSYINEKVNQFYQTHMEGAYIIGVHMRATDVTDTEEHNIHRRGSYRFEAYLKQIENVLSKQPHAKIFVATDSQEALSGLKKAFSERVIYSSSIFQNTEKMTGTGPSGWTIPGYLSENPDKAARNGEEAVIDYLLLSECNYLIHNGSGLARTSLLKNPNLKHFNVHSRRAYIRILFSSGGRELFQFIKFSFRNIRGTMKKTIKGLLKIGNV